MRTSVITVVVIILLTSACEERPAPEGSHTVRDSAGIRIIENTGPVWDDGRRWTLDSTSLVEIGGDPDDINGQFLYVNGIERLEDGQIVVSSGGTNEISVFDSTGAFLRNIGGSGDGPGEFDQVQGLYPCPGDSLAVRDSYHRIHLFDSNGEVVLTKNLTQARSMSLVLRGAASDCSSFFWLTGSDEPPPVGRMEYTPIALVWAELESTVVDTVGAFPWREVLGGDLAGQHAPIPVPWGRDGKFTAAFDRVYFGQSDRPEIRIFERGSGLAEVIRWDEEPKPVTRDDRALYQRKRDAFLEIAPPPLHGLSPELSAFPEVPDLMPFFLSLLVDDEENLWVREYPRSVAGVPAHFDLASRNAPLRENPPPGTDPETWKVFDKTGKYLGGVRIPADLVVFGIRGGRILTVWRDDFDVEHVRVYALQREG